MSEKKEHTPTIEEVLLSHYGWSETTMSDDFMQEFRKKYQFELAAMKEWASIETEQLTKRLEVTQHWLDEFQGSTALLGLETEQLRQENKRLKAIPRQLDQWMDQEIATAEAKLTTLSPLGRHALRVPMKAQIALLKEVQQYIRKLEANNP